MKLTHASVLPLSACDFKTPAAGHLKTHFKPVECLWMSRDHVWFKSFNQGCDALNRPYNHAYEAEVSELDLYWVDSEASALAFKNRFAVPKCNGLHY